MFKGIKTISSIAVMTAVVMAVVVTVQTAETDRYAQLRAFLQGRDTAAAAIEIAKLRTTEPAAMSEELSMLTAKVAIENGDLASALGGLLQASERRDVKNVALVDLSRIARASGNLMWERMLLQQILSSDASRTLANEARYRLAENLIETENFDVAAELITSVRRNERGGKPTLSASRNIASLLGQAELRMGRIENATAIYTKLLNESKPTERIDDASIEAVEALDLIGVGSDQIGKSVPRLSESEHITRGEIYLFDRDLDNMRLHFDAAIAISPYGPQAPGATLKIGRGYAQSGDHVEAIKWYERLLERYPEAAEAKDALLMLASAYSRVGRPKEAMTRYEGFIKRFPADEKLDRAYLNLVDLNRDLGEDQEALKWCQRTREAFKGKTVEAVAIFAEAKIRIARKEWPEALAALSELDRFSDLGGSSVPGGTSKAEVVFLRATILEESGKTEDALGVYKTVPVDASRYFSEMAAERFAAIAGVDIVREPVAEKKPVGKSRDTKPTTPPNAFDRLMRPATEGLVGQLAKVGAFDLAAAELLSGSPDAKKAAELGLAGDRGDLAVKYADRSFKDRPGHAELSPDEKAALRYNFPTPYRAALLRHSVADGVDPRLVLAIMRQESGFSPKALSYAGARGSMQFIMPTALRIGKQLSVDSVRRRSLYDPDLSIALSTKYLAGLFEMFPRMPEAVVASYNGGEDNMKRWVVRSRSNRADRYLPEIMFTQTKDYVQRVMSNYNFYKKLYDERLRPI
jgi:soluble lytic murein transglycosylase-like protein